MTIAEDEQVGAMLLRFINDCLSCMPGANKLGGDYTETLLDLPLGLLEYRFAGRIQFVRLSTQIQCDRNLHHVNRQN